MAWASRKYSMDNVAAGENINMVVAAYVKTEAGLKCTSICVSCGSLFCTVIHNRWSTFRNIMTPQIQNRVLSGSPHRWVAGVFLLLKNLYRVDQRTMRFRYLPLIRKTWKKCKVTDITLNYANSKVVNFATLRDMILENLAPMHVHIPLNIKRKHGGLVVLEPEI